MFKRRSLLQLAASAGITAAGMTAAGLTVAGCDDASPQASPPTGKASEPAASASPQVKALPPEVVTGPRDKPQVALTFHGQGDAGVVRQILGELAKGDAKATVLAVGTWLVAQPDMAKLVLDGGHELGNHTHNHLAIAKMRPDEARAEIQKCADQLQKLTGSIGTWFRPSQTQFSTDMIKAQAAAVGYPTCLSYDLDSLDYTDPGVTVIVGNVLNQVRNGSIVSLHFGHVGTVSAIPKILEGLRQRGLRPVTVTELVN
jgi:peptidoglycan/xylan/chitin deacetylase (PgdA/CDA1 family)